MPCYGRPAATSPQSPPRPTELNLGAAHAAIQVAAILAAERNRVAGPRATTRVQILFDPEGQVAAVGLDKPLQGTERGECVERAFLDTRVPRLPISVRKTVQPP